MTKNNETIPFSVDEIEHIRSTARRIWDDVGYDCLVATAEEKGKDINRVTIPRSQVIEIALDAGRPEEIFRSQLTTGKSVVTRDFLDRFAKVSYQQLIKMVKPAFPYRSYGL